MSIFFSSNNLINILCSYMKYQEITALSLINKKFYSLLKPENNAYINTLYRDICLKNYVDINIKNTYKLYKEPIELDEYNKNKINWKKVYKNLYINKKIHINKEITEDIYNSFYFHMYIPYQRNENKILEYNNNTLHQMYCYDINKNNSIREKYYDKFFKEKNESIKIEPLKRGQLFEEELINLKSEIKKYNNRKIMKFILNYVFKKLDKIYYSNIFNKNISFPKIKSKFNKIIYFLIYLNHSFILFVDLLFNYVLQFKNCHDPKIIIIEYNKAHTYLINFGLMINEKFNNINIIMLCLQKYKKENVKRNNIFSVYDMFLNIMKKQFYLKLKPLLNINIQKIINLFFNEGINNCIHNNNSFENNNVTSNNKSINDENDNNDDNNLNYSMDEIIEIEENDEDSFNINNFSYQKIIEEFSNLLLDFSINKDNSNYINHSKIKLSKCYNEYEKFLSKNFLENIKNYFKTNKNREYEQNDNNALKEEITSLKLLFSFLKKLYSKGKEEDELKLINRTKLNILKYSKIVIFNYVNNLINRYSLFPLDSNIIKNQYKNMNYNLLKLYDFLSLKIIYELNENKLLDIFKKNLIKHYSNILSFISKQIEQFINEHLYSNSKANILVPVIKDIILFIFNKICHYKRKDIQIIETIFKN